MTGKPYRVSHEYRGSASETDTLAPPSDEVIEKQQRQSVDDFMADLTKATSKVTKAKKQASRRGSKSPKTSA
jgi:hypothetical protein